MPTLYDSLITEATKKYDVPYDIGYNLLKAESSFNPNAVSPAGAQGIAQFMPSTAKEQGIDPMVPEQAIPGAMKYLRSHYDQFGSWPLALAAYNAGPGNVKKYNGVPPFKETQDYVDKIMKNYPQDKNMPTNIVKPIEDTPKNKSLYEALGRPQLLNMPNEEERILGGTLKDIHVSLTKGGVGALQGLVGLADIPTMGYAGKVVEDVGIDLNQMQQQISEHYSSAQKAANVRVESAQGFLPKLGAMIKDPSTIGHAIVESVPSIAAGGLIGRGALAMAPRIGGLAAGALGEGAITAGQTAEGIREQAETGEITGKQALMAAGAGLGTGLIGGLSGKVASGIAKKLGIDLTDIDTFAATGKFGSSAKKLAEKGKFTDNVAARIIAGGISEGAFEELPQSIQEQVWINAATGKDLTEGIGEAGAAGLLTGIAMGGGANVFTSSVTRESAGIKDQTDWNQYFQDYELQELNNEYQNIQAAKQTATTPEEQAIVKQRQDQVINQLHERKESVDAQNGIIKTPEEIQRDRDQRQFEYEQLFGLPIGVKSAQESAEAILAQRPLDDIEQAQRDRQRQIEETYLPAEAEVDRINQFRLAEAEQVGAPEPVPLRASDLITRDGQPYQRREYLEGLVSELPNNQDYEIVEVPNGFIARLTDEALDPRRDQMFWEDETGRYPSEASYWNAQREAIRRQQETPLQTATERRVPFEEILPRAQQEAIEATEYDVERTVPISEEVTQPEVSPVGTEVEQPLEEVVAGEVVGPAGRDLIAEIKEHNENIITLQMALEDNLLEQDQLRSAKPLDYEEQARILRIEELRIDDEIKQNKADRLEKKTEQALKSFQNLGRKPQFQTSEQVAEFRKANNLPEIQMREDESHPTQIGSKRKKGGGWTGTAATYDKVWNLMPDEIKAGKILDYGAGKNIGSLTLEGIKKIDSFEPYPEAGFTPTYKDTSKIPSNTYDGIFNNAVLNVVPDDIRNSIVREIGRVLAPNGKAYINVRGRDVLGAKHYVIADDPLEVIVARNKAYQKGFKPAELKNYLQETLGPNFVVDIPKGKDKFGAVAAIVTKKGVVQQELFQTEVRSEQEPGQGIGLAEVQKMYKDQEVFQSDDGEISVRFKNGKGATIQNIQDAGKGFIQFAIDTGQMSKEGKILGVTTGNNILLDSEFADNATLWHENKHVLDNLGMITEKDNSLLNKEFNKLRKANRLNFGLSTHEDPRLAMEENRANTFAQIMVEREAYRETALGKVIQKIMDFFNGLLGIGRQTLGGFVREVETGKIYERETGLTEDQTIPQFQQAGNTNSKEFKNWFKDSKVVDASGKPLVVYHGTNAENIFTVFDKEKLGTKTEAESAKKGFFFAEDPETANAYSTKEFFLDQKISKESGGNLEVDGLQLIKNIEKVFTDLDVDLSDPYGYFKSNILADEKNNLPRDFEYLLNVLNTLKEDPNNFRKLATRNIIDPYRVLLKQAKEMNLPELLSGIITFPQARTYQTYLSMQKPFIYDFKGKPYRETTYNDLMQKAIDNGHDGVIFKNTYDGAGKTNIYGVFDNKNIKSIYNRGTWSQTDSDIMFEIRDQGVSDLSKPEQKISDDVYKDIYEQQSSLVEKLNQNIKKTGREINRGMNKYLGMISTNLKKINPMLEGKVRKLGFDTTQAIKNDLETAKPLLDKLKDMSAQDKSDWHWARVNGDGGRIRDITDKYGMTETYRNVRESLNRIRREAEEVGYNIGFIDEYWPRILKDRTGFLQATKGLANEAVFSDALKAQADKLGTTVDALDDGLKADIISNIILGRPSGIGGPVNIRQRYFAEVPPEYAKFYMDSDAALMSYIYSMNKKIEARKFFGKVPERIARIKKDKRTKETRLASLTKLESNLVADGQDTTIVKEQIQELQDDVQIAQNELDKYGSQDDFKENIGSYVMDLMVKEKLNPGTGVKANDEQALKDILTARFNEKGTTGLANVYKNLSYIDTMGSPVSAITQLGDLAWAVYVGGLTPRGIANSVRNIGKAILGKSDITREDIGITRIAQEFADGDTLSNAVSKIFKIVGIEKLDRIGKEALINNSFDNYRRKAEMASRDAKEMERFKTELRPIFGSKSEKVINDLLDPNVASQSDDVKLLVYSRLLDFQPADLSETPEAYLNAGNGRLFYMLKMFTLKQFDVFRREVWHNIKTGERDKVIQGLGNMTRLLAVLSLANAGADELKDLVLGKDTKFEDHVIENLLTLGGASRYLRMQTTREGIGSGLAGQILPPFKFIDAISKDVMNDTRDGLRSVDSIPVGGKLYYWHLGRGKDKRESIEEKDFKKETKEFRKFKKDFDNSEDKRLFLRSNLDQFKQMKFYDNMSKAIRGNKATIDKLKDIEQTPNVRRRLSQLEQQRKDLIKRYFEMKERL